MLLHPKHTKESLQGSLSWAVDSYSVTTKENMTNGDISEKIVLITQQYL